jgi:hypothetical protein
VQSTNESHWKEIILLWFGSTDRVTDKDKEDFLDKLITFQGKDFDFYQFQANFLAAACTTEYVAHPENRQIIHWLTALAFNRDFWSDPPSQTARRIILEINRKTAISELLKLSQICEDPLIQRFLIQGLAEVSSGEKEVVKYFISLIRFPGNESDTYSHDAKHCQAIEGLGNIGIGSSDAYNALERLYSSKNIDGYTRKLAAMSLYKIAPEAIPELSEFVKDAEKLKKTNLAEVEESIAVCPNSVSELIALIQDESKDEAIRVRASAKLSKFKKLNKKQLSKLLSLLFNSSESLTRFLAVQVLEDVVNQGFQSFVVSAISKQLNSSTSSKDFDLHRSCYRIAWKCAQNMNYFYFHQSWHSH